MKNASPALVAYLTQMTQLSDAPLYIAELFTITLTGGNVLRFTSTDIPITWEGNVFSANSLLVSGLKYKSSIGLSVDTQQITLSASPDDKIGDIPVIHAIHQGLFDAASIVRERAFLSSWTSPPLGTVIMFKGRVTAIDSIGKTTASLTVASDLVLLDINMPRNIYQPTCNHTLYDAGCGLSKAAFSSTGAAETGSNQSNIVWSSSSLLFQQGTIRWTSGANTGVSRNVVFADDTGLSLAYPLDSMPEVGDTFSVSQGCDHCMATCHGKFNNLSRFRGFPFVPSRNVVTGFS